VWSSLSIDRDVTAGIACPAVSAVVTVAGVGPRSDRIVDCTANRSGDRVSRPKFAAAAALISIINGIFIESTCSPDV
jgi:hypothetical protein